MQYLGYILLGLVAGFASKLLGMGGGVLVVPVLIFFFALPMKMAVGTSLAYIAPVALSGALQDAFKGYINYRIALVAIPFGIMGTYIGSKVSDGLKGNTLKVVFGVLMILVGLKMVLLPGGWGELSDKVKGRTEAGDAAGLSGQQQESEGSTGRPSG
ncbi:MAG: sulfite exporter TauE/SafE family protein [Candidatus Brocadiia bacterium]|nr:sulfite exporter TauE/SafE family protein [Candidatus Brocadiia bacterium]